MGSRGRSREIAGSRGTPHLRVCEARRTYVRRYSVVGSAGAVAEPAGGREVMRTSYSVCRAAAAAAVVSCTAAALVADGLALAVGACDAGSGGGGAGAAGGAREAARLSACRSELAGGSLGKPASRSPTRRARSERRSAGWACSKSRQRNAHRPSQRIWRWNTFFQLHEGQRRAKARPAESSTMVLSGGPAMKKDERDDKEALEPPAHGCLRAGAASPSAGWLIARRVAPSAGPGCDASASITVEQAQPQGRCHCARPCRSLTEYAR